MARTRRNSTPPQRLILDSGAVIALSRNDARARAALRAADEAGAQASIPSVVLAETVRGAARDAPVNRVMNAVGQVVSAGESTGRVAGGLLGAAKSNSTVDGPVVATAIGMGGAVILTDDPGDLGHLAVEHVEVLVQSLKSPTPRQQSCPVPVALGCSAGAPWVPA
ncbi:MAG: type II toxin-antitoxin system VapC family toxin [Microthrixaceae bacterium]